MSGAAAHVQKTTVPPAAEDRLHGHRAGEQHLRPPRVIAVSATRKQVGERQRELLDRPVAAGVGLNRTQTCFELCANLDHKKGGLHTVP